MVYDLTEEETAALTSGSIEEHPVERRLETLNRIIGEDFADPVTVEVLDSERRIDIGLHPEIAREPGRAATAGRGGCCGRWRIRCRRKIYCTEPMRP